MSDDKPSVGQLIGYLKEKHSLWLIAVALILGICLMLFGSGGDGAQSVSATVGSAETSDTTDLEGKVKALCERVIGVGDVSVMITLDTLGEQLYAMDMQTSQDGERREEHSEYVTVSQGLVPTGELTPRVRGIAIVCSGGDDATVQLKLTNLLCALFGISASSVSIVGGN